METWFLKIFYYNLEAVIIDYYENVRVLLKGNYIWSQIFEFWIKEPFKSKLFFGK